MTTSTYRLVIDESTAPVAFVPDEAQRAVLAHETGPLLVLAGPGTGKTSTLVEYVGRRVEAGLAPESVLTLTFSRKAAQELRTRITRRLGVATSAPPAWTFHAWCHAFLREQQLREAPAQASRLLTGAEQDVAVRALLAGSIDAPRADLDWPATLRACLHTAGLAREVRAVLSRLAELGMGGGDLTELGRRFKRSDWQVLGRFAEDYLDVLDAEGVTDYGELLRRAVILAETPPVMAALRERYALVVVDEYQDTDPLQERLLAAIAGDGRTLVAVGDPDQAIYAFRGGDVDGLLRFTERFRHAGGSPARTLALGTSRRCGPAILEAAGRLSRRLPAAGLDPAALRHHRAPRALGPAEATAVVATFASATAEAQGVGAELRRAHLHDGIAWPEMAVLVRSSRAIPLLRRVLGSAGVPVVTGTDEVPLADEPAVAPLLLALRCATDESLLTAETARVLLTGPLVGCDAGLLRRLSRRLRAAARAGGDIVPPSSAEVIRAVVVDPAGLIDVPAALAWPVRVLHDLLAAARTASERHGGEAALWELWSGSRSRQRWVQSSDGGGEPGRAADRDLDAVVALFAAAARAAETRLGAGPTLSAAALIEIVGAQEIPVHAAREVGLPAAGVRLMTAHRSKGLEWDLVAVVGVQEGVWPDLRGRGSLLEPDRIGWPSATGELPAAATRSELLADERRLLFVAVTRARRRLLVTAVDAAAEDGVRPSRLLRELGLPAQPVPAGDDSEPLTLDALVVRLRQLAVDAPSPAFRRAAATRLAALAAVRDAGGVAVAPLAAPETWWGSRGLTDSDVPVRDPTVPLALSGSQLSTLDTCPLQWFLDHEVHAERPKGAAISFGSVIHALAQEVSDGATPATLDALTARLDEVWGSLGYAAPWQSEQQRDVARDSLRRFLDWHHQDRGRRTLGAEIDYAVNVEVATPAGDPRVIGLRGSFDRVELDSRGRAWVSDFKTGKRQPSAAEVERHPQLGTYQLAVRAGALDHLLDRQPELGGAELVQLRKEAAGGGPAVQGQVALPDAQPSWVEQKLGAAAALVAAEQFHPLVGDACRTCAFTVCCPAHVEGGQVLA